MSKIKPGNFSMYVVAFICAIILCLIWFGCATPDKPGTLDPRLGLLQELVGINPVALAPLVPEIAKYDSLSLEEQRSVWSRVKGATENPYYLQLIDQEIAKIDARIVIRDTPPPPTPTPEPTPAPGENPGGEQDFLWKPVSETTGNLVVLFPNEFWGLTESAAVLMADGSGEHQPHLHTESHNGNRPHYRFSKPGSAYGRNATVVLTLKDGSTKTWPISNGANRIEL